MTARMPEPQTLWTVTQGTVSGMPGAERGLAGRRLADARLEDVAHDDLLDLVGADPGPLEGRRGWRRRRGPARAARRACPRNEPTGVRAAERMTTFFHAGDSNRRGHSRFIPSERGPLES